NPRIDTLPFPQAGACRSQVDTATVPAGRRHPRSLSPRQTASTMTLVKASLNVCRDDTSQLHVGSAATAPHSAPRQNNISESFGTPCTCATDGPRMLRHRIHATRCHTYDTP